jgi:hypothetical protein
MHRLVFVLSSAALVFSCLPGLAQEQAISKTLLVKTDMDCNWKLDGQPMGLLKADDSKVVPVSPGEHLIRAATTDGLVKIRTKVEVDQGQNTVELQLKSRHDQKLKIQQAEIARKQAEAVAALHPTWTDPDSGLMWTKKDNGSDVNWKQASDYCSNLQLAGYKDWRLPTIEELQGIDDPSVSLPQPVLNHRVVNVHVKGNLQLTGWEWSSTLKDCPGKICQVRLHFDFNLQKPSDSDPNLVGFPVGGFYWNMRALCVRRSGENIPEQTAPALPKGGDENSPG